MPITPVMTTDLILSLIMPLTSAGVKDANFTFLGILSNCKEINCPLQVSQKAIYRLAQDTRSQQSNASVYANFVMTW